MISLLSAYCTTFFCNKVRTLLTPWGRVSCISKTACFSVSCTPLSLQFGWNEEPKGSKGLVCQSAVIELHPLNWTRPHFCMQSLSQSEAFPPLSPGHSDVDNEHDITLHIKASASAHQVGCIVSFCFLFIFCENTI